MVVVDYPRLFNGTDCNVLTWFSPSRDDAAEPDRRPAEAQSSAAAAASAGFGFVDLIPAFIGHAVCDGGTEWINGLSNPMGESYHPKITGHASGYYPVIHTITG